MKKRLEDLKSYDEMRKQFAHLIADDDGVN